MSRSAERPPVGGIHEAALYADDLAAAEAFWTRLGFDVHSRAERRHVFFRAGRDMLLLFDPAATSTGGGPVPPHGARGPGHVAFDVPGRDALEAWRTRLDALGIEVEAELDWPNGGRSIYFRDPAGNRVEFITRGSWGG